MFEHCTIFIVPLVFPAVVVGHLPEEFIGQSPSCLSQTSLQILTIKTDHVKVLNAGETHDLAGQIPVSVNVLKRNTKSLVIFHNLYQICTWNKMYLSFSRSKRKTHEVYNMLLYWKEFTYFLIFSKRVVIFNVILNFFESFSINNVVISFDWKRQYLYYLASAEYIIRLIIFAL